MIDVVRFIKPIHAPGAVQGFGVLIALVEDEETGNLVVRQVSEVILLFSFIPNTNISSPLQHTHKPY